MYKKTLIIFLLMGYFFIHPSQSVAQTSSSDWSMVGANPQRTSWVSEEVRGNLNVDWYHPIEPYIPYKFQPIAANGKIYVSTARGLYAFNATNGNLDWVFPTEVPLGNSPTVVTINTKSIAFVPGYDRKIYAVDALTGTAVAGYTPYEQVGAGFETNPVVVNNTIYAGNRDGYFYALDAVTGGLKWKFQTGGPIVYSPAYKNNAVYFASQDMYAYALNATTGAQIWKSNKFPGTGFYSYWPVIYTNKSTNKDYVVFTGGSNLRNAEYWLPQSYETSYFNGLNLPSSKLTQTSSPITGDWVSGTVTMDGGPVADYLATNANRRTTFVLDSANGQEFTYTYNGKQNYAPFNYSGVTRGGSKYPPLVNGVDGVFYQQMAYEGFSNWVFTGAPVGWKFGTQYLSRISDFTQASDEPVAYSSGGKIIYWSLCCDRFARGYDVTIPATGTNRAWVYWNYGMANAASSMIPGYEAMYDNGYSTVMNNIDGWQSYSGKNKSKNGIYAKHSMTQSPPIPYQGKLFFLRGNSLIAFSPTGSNPTKPLPLATIVSAQSTAAPPSSSVLQSRLETEIQKMIAAGHLKPGYLSHSFSDQYANGNYTDEREFGEILDYFSNPADTVYTLLLAYPYVSQTTQANIKTYVANNYGPGKTYDITRIINVGYQNGASRQWSDIPPEAISKFQTNQYGSAWAPRTTPICGSCGYWQNFSPFNFYAAWKYAQIIGNNDPTTAKNIFNSMSGKMEAPPSDTWLINKPYFINLYASGYYGYLQLKQLAGLGGDATVQSRYDHMLSLRINNFSKDTVYWGNTTSSLGPINYNQSLSVARNFMFMVPEIAEYMNQNIKAQVQTAVDEYNYVGPYWFVNGFDSQMGEGTLSYLYNSPALFQAKAKILKQPYNEIVKYLDAPAFEKGDLFYIQNLATALSVAPKTNSPFQVNYLSTDAHGVKSYDMASNNNGNGHHILRILEPTNPAAGVKHTFLYVLPVEAELNTQFGDGLETLRILNAHNTYNATIIAPSFKIFPWYADHATDPNYHYETFMTEELQPWVKANLSSTGTEQHWLLGFSKSGYGGLDLLFKHPDLFTVGAFWDFPANMANYTDFSADTNYGTQANFDSNYRLTSAFLENYKSSFLTSNRIWISGYGLFQTDVASFDQLLTSKNIKHTTTLGVSRTHRWDSGWVASALEGLAANSANIGQTGYVKPCAKDGDTGVSSTPCDGTINITDYTFLSGIIAKGIYDPKADLKPDGLVNIQDYVVLSTNYGK